MKKGYFDISLTDLTKYLNFQGDVKVTDVKFSPLDKLTVDRTIRFEFEGSEEFLPLEHPEGEVPKYEFSFPGQGQ